MVFNNGVKFIWKWINSSGSLTKNSDKTFDNINYGITFNTVYHTNADITTIYPMLVQCINVGLSSCSVKIRNVMESTTGTYSGYGILIIGN